MSRKPTGSATASAQTGQWVNTAALAAMAATSSPPDQLLEEHIGAAMESLR